MERGIGCENIPLYGIYCDLENEGRLDVTRAVCQQQGSGVDCGLFSIAFANHAARGDDVSKLQV